MLNDPFDDDEGAPMFVGAPFLLGVRAIKRLPTRTETARNVGGGPTVEASDIGAFRASGSGAAI